MKDEARLHERTAGRRTFAKYPIGKTIVMSKHTATETKGKKAKQWFGLPCYAPRCQMILVIFRSHSLCIQKASSLQGNVKILAENLGF